MKYCSLVYSARHEDLKSCLKAVLKQTSSKSVVYVCGDWTVGEKKEMTKRVNEFGANPDITEQVLEDFER